MVIDRDANKDLENRSASFVFVYSQLAFSKE